MTLHKIAQGAEAVLYQDASRILKERPVKRYRLPEIDERLRGFRTRREAKVLQKLAEAGFPAPRLLELSEKNKTLVMERIPGKPVRDILLGQKMSSFSALAKEIGKLVGQLHAQHIIHGDLTTSNMILHDEKKRVFFIDFGLSFFSEKSEDKAVDLFLLERALESTHYALCPAIWEDVLVGYKTSADAAAVQEGIVVLHEGFAFGMPEASLLCTSAQTGKLSRLVLERLEEVRRRGRNKKN